MQNQNTTETQTNTETELDLDLWDICDNLEAAQGDFENVRTLLTEIAYDLQYEIKHDGTPEDEQRKASLIRRRPTMQCFLIIALEYVIRLQDTVLETIKNLHAYGKQDK